MGYLKATANEKMYSDYLWATREAEKEEAMEPYCSQTADKPSKPKVMIFFPLQRLKGTQPTKTPAMTAVHLEEEGSNEKAGAKSEYPDGNDGIMEEFIVNLSRAVKEAQQDEKCCYHCSSTEHFICECPLVKAPRLIYPFKPIGGNGTREGSSSQGSQAKGTPGGDAQSIGCHKQTPFLNPTPFLWWCRVKNIVKVRINGDSCMALLDNGVQINTITPHFVEEHSLNVGPLSDLVGT